MSTPEEGRWQISDLRRRADFLAATASEHGRDAEGYRRVLAEIQRLRAEADELEAALDDEADD